MSTPTADQIVAANKAQIDTLLGLSNKALEGVEKLVALNLAASKALLATGATNAQAALSVKDATDAANLPASTLQPLGEKAASYGREAYEIITTTNAEFTKAFEAQFAEAQKKFLELVESTSANAPAGSETVVALFKSAVSAANNLVETAQKSAKQAAALADSNIKAATSTVAEAASSAAAGTKKRA
jgi:phasin family protein